jgi:outer membrane beta-barrel protein
MHKNADLNSLVTRRSEKDKPMTNKPKTGGSRGHKRLAMLIIAAAVTALPLAAQAQRKSPLADAPAIRKKFELRATRLEVGAGMSTTINQDYFHSVFFDLRVGFHLLDSLAITGFGDFAVANVESTLQSNVLHSLYDSMQQGHPYSEPTRADAARSMQKIKGMYGVQLEWSPVAGKYSLFGKLFAHYDFYVMGGLGAINVAPADVNIPACASTNNRPLTDPQRYYCGVSGTKIGGTFGIGFHSYFNHWLALNVELRDLLAKLNPSGRDTNGDLRATTDDLNWTHTISVGAQLVFYLPATPGISP